MSTTATNGAATETAFEAITKAASAASNVVADAVASIGPSVESAIDKARQFGQTWTEATVTVTGLALNAYDASVTAYVDYAKSVAAASQSDWLGELTERGAALVTELALNYTNTARSLLAT